ncbi:MAG: hypothetical protein IJ254_07550 [Succinivibrio sp.]|jgi:hypothetical protein|nr:hypothetical protein [Succinivibrio sp.]
MDEKKELESIRKTFENDSAYVHALKELIEKNDSYGKLFAMSLLCLIQNIAHKKWTTKDNIKQDFKETVKLFIGSSSLDEKEKAGFARQVYFAVLQVASMFPLVDGISVDFKDIEETNSNMNLAVKSSKLKAYSTAQEYVDQCYSQYDETQEEKFIESVYAATLEVMNKLCETIDFHKNQTLSKIEYLQQKLEELGD